MNGRKTQIFDHSTSTQKVMTHDEWLMICYISINEYSNKQNQIE